MNQYTKKKIHELTRLTERQVQFYTEQGVVTPEIDLGEGRGKIRLYSTFNLMEFVIIKALVDLGMTIGKIKKILKNLDHPMLRKYESDLFKRSFQCYLKIFIDNNDKAIAGFEMTQPDYKGDISINRDYLKTFHTCIVINFGSIIQSIKE